MWQDYENHRRVRTLSGVVQLHLKIRRCPNPQCERYHPPSRPESEGLWALPQQEFGLDVIAWVGALRHQEHRSIAEIHQQLRLRQRELCISERTVSNLLGRYDELLALALSEPERLAGQSWVTPHVGGYYGNSERAKILVKGRLD
jgi:hypothetical protein